MIISLSGKAGSGKSTIAGIMAETLHAERVGLASVLRDELVDLGMPRHLMDTQEGKASSLVWEGTEKTVRQVMQEHGVRRAQEDVNWLLRPLLQKCNNGIYIVDDMRRKNEAQGLAYAGPVIRIEHHNPGADSCMTECDLDEWPYFDATFYPEFGELKMVAFHILRQFAHVINPGNPGAIYILAAKLIEV